MRYEDEKKEKLEKLERKLYARNAPNIMNAERSELPPVQEDYESRMKSDWSDMPKSNFDELAAKLSNMAQKKNKFVRKIFLFSIIFFFVSFGVAAFVFLGGLNMVSSKNVDIKVTGPLSVGSGQEASFDVSVINNNTISLDSVSLLVEYPTGTRYTADLSKEFTQERFDLGVIKPGKSYNQNIKAAFFGDKGSSKEMKMSLEYKVENSSALFYKDKSVEISISSAPVIITPTYPKEVNSGQSIQFSVEVASNSKDTISGFLVSADYPFGFVFSDASPKASFGNNVWQFTEFKSGEKKTITIRGSLLGQDNEEKVFKIKAGTGSADDERVIAVPFSELAESVTIKKPFLGLDVSVGGQSGDLVAQGGSSVTTNFTLRNNLPSRLFDSSVVVTLRGGAFDGLSVSPSSGGFFESFNNSILWDQRSVSALADMGPGESQNFSFRLSPLTYDKIAKGSKPEIEIVVSVSGNRILESGSVERVSATETHKITLGTDISLSAKTVRALGTIENSGPIPPKANIPTTYTVVWSIANSLNQVSNVQVKAALPSYVKWTGVKSPASESLSFNDSTHELVWNAGSVLPNTGFGSAKKEIYFQLELLPSTSQIGQTPSLSGLISLTGLDKATGRKIEKTAPAVTADFSGDPSFKAGNEKVVE